jgi:hypothetical protein
MRIAYTVLTERLQRHRSHGRLIHGFREEAGILKEILDKLICARNIYIYKGNFKSVINNRAVKIGV